jgi:hypothetical protein
MSGSRCLGKSAFQDRQLVLNAFVQLHDAMRDLLEQQLPDLADEWRRREPEGWLLCTRIPHDVRVAGRSARRH